MMLDHVPYDVLARLFSFLDLRSAKSLRLVNKDSKSLVYDLIIKR